MDTGSFPRSTPGTVPYRTAALCAVLLAMAGCAAGPPATAPASPSAIAAIPPQDDSAWAAAGAGMLPKDDNIILESPESLLHVSEAMHAFVLSATSHEGTQYGKIAALSQAMGSKRGLNLEYDPEATLSAEDVFKQRRANCLSYTLLFIALAREIGVEARFNEVDVPPIWDLGDESTSLLYRHINARTDFLDLITEVIDISDDYDPKWQQKTVSDQEGEAQYYNNRSVQLRLQQHPLEALRYEVRALQLAPQSAFLWTNLAGLYLQQSNGRAARAAIDQALKLDDGDMLAYDMAANVYEQSGDNAVAARFREQAQDFREHNPYYHYQRGLAALRDGNLLTAHDQLLQAIRLYPSEARFHFLMALVQSGLGNSAEASHSLDTAIALTPSASQQSRYKSKFARLSHQG